MSLDRLKQTGLARSRAQERRIADENGGSVNSQSGAGWVRKNDVRTPTESWELKTTRSMQFILKLADLRKAWTQAVIDNRRMVFGIEFGDGAEYVVLYHDDYIELRDGWEQQWKRAESLSREHVRMVEEVVKGLSTSTHAISLLGGLANCKCGHRLTPGFASRDFITHALAVRAGA